MTQPLHALVVHGKSAALCVRRLVERVCLALLKVIAFQHSLFFSASVPRTAMDFATIIQPKLAGAHNSTANKIDAFVTTVVVGIMLSQEV